MKKKYNFMNSLLAMCTLVAFNASAQLSGVVSINSAAATTGTNYQSFTALASVLNSQGVNGPLTVNVVASSGPYNEQVNFTQAPGISATNTITVNGNGCTLSFNATSATLLHTLLLSGADYMTFNNLNVVGLGGSYALVCHLWNNADNNRFNNCTFTAPLLGTATGQSPFSISGTSVSATASGAGGSNNTISTCTMSGGYYNTVFAGATTSPFNTNNKVLNSYMVDFYAYGFYNLYCQGSVAKGNVVERLNRTNSTTCYAMYLSTGSTANGLIEGNHIRKLFNAIPGSTSASYCIYLIADATVGNENIVRNNIVSDINTNGAIYGIYLSGAAYSIAYHNTLSFDDATATAGLVYGIYLTGPNQIVRNNIVYVSRTGSGAKYCLYVTTAATSLICNNNVLDMNSTTGTFGTAYLTSAYSTLAAWQAGTGFDLASSSADPIFTSPSTMNYAPTSTVINNMGTPVGVTTDFNNATRSMATPDPGAIEFYNTPCGGTPGANSVITPTASYCPGSTVNIAVANTYTNSGYSYQWMSSTVSVVGPFTSIPGATLATHSTAPLNTNIYYSAIITCTQANASINAVAGLITVAPTTTNNIPYYESFESLAPNKLPNCSWSASNLGGTSLTQTVSNNGGRIPRTGNNFAMFNNAPALVNYFYTNGIFMKAGVTYSASLWYITDLLGSTNWSDLSILVGPNQTPVGQTTIASTNGPATSPFHKSLSNTFSVNTTGIYYVAVRATANPGTAQYLSWDDLAIEIPCSLNNPYVSIATNYTSACSGAPFNLSASGADSYTWSTGSNASAITVTPAPSTTSYFVIGSSTLSGCTKTVSQAISVNLSPQVNIFTSNAVSCAGRAVTLTAVGASIYNWNNGSTSPSIVVSPTANMSYSVIGVNAAGCSSMAVQQITVNPLPNIITASNANKICAGESVTLTGIGGSTYQWSPGPSIIQFGNPLVVSPQTSVTYTLTGTDNKGCTNQAYVTIEVNECTGLTERNVRDGFKVYPNPASGLITMEFADGAPRKVEITDFTGKIVLSQASVSQTLRTDLHGLPNGVYMLKVVSDKGLSTMKLIKQD